MGLKHDMKLYQGQSLSNLPNSVIVLTFQNGLNFSK